MVVRRVADRDERAAAGLRLLRQEGVARLPGGLLEAAPLPAGLLAQQAGGQALHGQLHPQRAGHGADVGQLGGPLLLRPQPVVEIGGRHLQLAPGAQPDQGGQEGGGVRPARPGHQYPGARRERDGPQREKDVLFNLHG